MWVPMEFKRALNEKKVDDPKITYDKILLNTVPLIKEKKLSEEKKKGGFFSR